MANVLYAMWIMIRIKNTPTLPIGITCVVVTSDGVADLVGLEVPVFPLHEYELSYGERHKQNHNHFGVHGVMALMFLVHPQVI